MNQTQIHAEELAERIRRGDWQPGMRLPSVRAYARDKGISPTTAVEIYELLKLRGLVEAAPRSGIFVSRALRPDLHLPQREAVLLPSASVAPEDLIADMNAAASDPRIFPFGAAIPAPDFLPLAALARLTRQVLRENPEILASYRFPPGASALRQLLAARYRRLGVNVEADDVVAASGAIEGIGLVLATVARPDDVVAVESPTYPGILQLVKAQGYRLLEIPLDAQRGLTPEALRQALDKAGGRLRAVVTIPNFANPLGTLVSDADKQALVEMASRAGIVLIEDDIYGDLAHGRRRPLPLKAWDRDDSVALCTSFAKTVSPALRAGFVLNGRLARQVAAQKYARTSGLSALAEEVLRRFLEQGHYDRHLQRVRSHYQTLIDRHAALVLQQFPAGTRVSQPAGGFILWVELPRGVDARLLQKRALQKRISVAPGSIFSEGGEHYLNYLRLNCALPWSEGSQRALRELARLAAQD